MLRDRNGIQVSEADGRPLPVRWDDATTIQKAEVIHAYQRRPDCAMPKWFVRDLDFQDRIRVKHHLIAVGSVQTVSHNERDAILRERAEASLRAKRAVNEYRREYQEITTVWSDQAVEAPPPSATSYGLYDRPNGGKRMLPSVYGRLTDVWMRGDGKWQRVEGMNDGHIENTLKLLKESHGNVTARATDLLGRMALHFQNDAEMVLQLQHLCTEMQCTEVDEMYPIWTKLAAELEKRVHDRLANKKQVQLELQVDFDDELESFGRSAYGFD